MKYEESQRAMGCEMDQKLRTVREGEGRDMVCPTGLDNRG